MIGLLEKFYTSKDIERWISLTLTFKSHKNKQMGSIMIFKPLSFHAWYVVKSKGDVYDSMLKSCPIELSAQPNSYLLGPSTIPSSREMSLTVCQVHVYLGPVSNWTQEHWVWQLVKLVSIWAEYIAKPKNVGSDSSPYLCIH
jgi:hypothetical protein